MKFKAGQILIDPLDGEIIKIIAVDLDGYYTIRVIRRSNRSGGEESRDVGYEDELHSLGVDAGFYLYDVSNVKEILSQYENEDTENDTNKP